MLTKEQIIEVLKGKKDIQLMSKEHQKQIFEYAFGEKFMESKDKGTLKQYEENNHE